MHSWSSLAPHFMLQCRIYVLLLGICSALKLTVPSHTIRGIEGQPLTLPVDYNFNITVSDIQIIWLFEKPPTTLRYLLISVNQSVVPDLEYRHKFTLTPPNASLLIKSLHLSDEGSYIIKINIYGNGTIPASAKIQVTVDVPVTKPVIYTEPLFGVVENSGNITLKCTVEKGTRIVYQWMKNGYPIEASTIYSLSANNDVLWIAPVIKEAIGNYSCLAENPVSAMESDMILPTIYYGPYGLTINSDNGQKLGDYFTVDKGEAVQLYCSADSNPPNNYSWIRRADNSTHLIKYGRSLEVGSEKVTQKTEEYRCRAVNNMTGKWKETHIFVIIMPKGLEQLAQKGKYLSPLGIITGISLFLIVSMCFLTLWKRFQPHKVLQQKLQTRPEADYRKAQTISGHENALDDFGIYEFVAFPDPAGISRVSSRSVSGSDMVHGQDFNGTVYEVIRHIPEQHQEYQE
ncbi:LOW QUALITY PROTEIN: HEPACAM family member 2 [Rhineura floridana]|uniref:LOW QUALITY PROTEIN: HEPACAM family member 2 n=1 Tax=Rhineura floridana TaxID=261503 RepID=UPI002AC81975|nr:LOW QUALITY PROTEIN: HEPACAM family member 2 [Rhineura floridana]